jgi:hypothetical protein
MHYDNHQLLVQGTSFLFGEQAMFAVEQLLREPTLRQQGKGKNNRNSG